MSTRPEDEALMREALREAARAEARGEVPVGAVVVVGGEIVGRGHNLRETAQDPLAHAELIAVRKAAARLGSWRLVDATVYVTLEPCPMCAGMLVNARVPRVVWGADDPKAGACRTLYQLGDDPRLNHRFESVPGVLEVECADALRRFFAAIRARRR
ncbi:MAG: tRNA adenosine(34) deaminase TadA [Myxococcales bacterium]|nr:tRNA adenosine(34) deaminase TadA [Myxococcales bacterium]